jgi:hypothetical protein
VLASVVLFSCNLVQKRMQFYLIRIFYLLNFYIIYLSILLSYMMKIITSSSTWLNEWISSIIYKISRCKTWYCYILYCLRCFFLCVSAYLTICLISMVNRDNAYFKWFIYCSSTIRWQDKTRQIGIISHCLQIHQGMGQLFVLLFCHLQLLLLYLQLSCLRINAVKTTTLTFSALLSADDKAACTVWIAIPTSS